MSVNIAIDQLLEVEERRKENVYDAETMAVGVARVGSSSQLILADEMGSLKNFDFGLPLHSFVIVGKTHIMEDEMLKTFKPTSDSPLLQTSYDSDQ